MLLVGPFSNQFVPAAVSDARSSESRLSSFVHLGSNQQVSQRCRAASASVPRCVFYGFIPKNHIDRHKDFPLLSQYEWRCTAIAISSCGLYCVCRDAESATRKEYVSPIRSTRQCSRERQNVARQILR